MSVEPDVQVATINLPPSIASASRRMLAPCESIPQGASFKCERDRTYCCAVRSSPWMSVQPDIPIFVLVASASRDSGFFANAGGQTSACTFFASDSNQTNCVSGSYSACFPSGFSLRGREGLNVPLAPWDVCSTRHPELCFSAPSVVCKGEEGAFSVVQRVKPLRVASL